MSFFKDFKEDLSQAVNELMPEEEAQIAEAIAGVEEFDDSASQSEDYSDLFASFDSAEVEEAPAEEEEYEEVIEEVEDDEDVEYEEVVEYVEVDEDELEDGEEYEEVEEVVEEDDIDYFEEAATEPEPETAATEDAAEEASYADTMAALSAEPMSEPQPGSFNDGPINTVTSPIFSDSAPSSAPINTIWEEQKKASVGVIIDGMTVKGDIVSDGCLDVMGSVEGNIDIKGKLNITGKIDGDSKADEIFVNGAKVTGEILSSSTVKVAQGSVIRGNIKAAAAVFAGAVKGDIDVQGPVILDSTAVIVGNIKSKSIQINNGAIIEGSCSQCYSEVTASNYFSEEE